jgi:hypothetical protein
LVKSPHNIITRTVLAKEKEANMVMVMREKKMTKSILAMLLVASPLLVSVEAGSNFADSLAECSAVQELNICLRETLEDLRPLMKVGLPGLGLAVAEPMAVDAISFQQGGQPGLPSPVTIRSTFTNVLVEGLSTFHTDYIDADPLSQTLRIGLTVPVMDISGLYQINGEVFILPLEGSGSFTTKMLDVTAEGFSSIVPVETAEGKQMLQVVDSNLDFKIGKVIIHMNNLFNGENELLANTVNKFLNDHGQEVLKEVKPAIRDQLRNLVTRVMNDAFSSLPADQLLNNLVRSARSGQSTPAPGLLSAPNQPPTNPHFSANAQPLQNQQGILKPGLLGQNPGVKGFNQQGLHHNHNQQGPANLGQNVPGSLNLGLNRGLNPPGPPNNHNQALGAFPGLQPHNQERRGGNRVNLFSFLHGVHQGRRS